MGHIASWQRLNFRFAPPSNRLRSVYPRSPSSPNRAVTPHLCLCAGSERLPSIDVTQRNDLATMITFQK